MSECSSVYGRRVCMCECVQYYEACAMVATAICWQPRGMARSAQARPHRSSPWLLNKFMYTITRARFVSKKRILCLTWRLFWLNGARRIGELLLYVALTLRGTIFTLWCDIRIAINTPTFLLCSSPYNKLVILYSVMRWINLLSIIYLYPLPTYCFFIAHIVWGKPSSVRNNLPLISYSHNPRLKKNKLYSEQMVSKNS